MPQPASRTARYPAAHVSPCLALALLVLLPHPSPAAEAGPRLLGDSTLFEMEQLDGAVISPDGSQVVFSRRRVDQQADRFRSNLWRLELASGRITELTPGPWEDSSPVFSPDGSRLAFLSDRGGTTQLHVLYLDSGQVAQLTHFEYSPGDVSWSPDGRRLAFTLFVPAEDPALAIQLPKPPGGAERAPGAILVDRLTWARDGRGYLPPGFTHVFVLDASLGGTPRQVTDGDYDHQDPAFSADGKTLYFSGIRKPDAEYLREDSEIYAADLSTGTIRPLTDRKGPDGRPRVSPDGRSIAYLGYDEKGWTSHIPSLYVMDADGGHPRALATDLPDGPQSVVWAPDSQGVFFIVEARGSAQIHHAPLNGPVRAITEGVQVLADLSIATASGAGRGRAAAVRSTPYRPDELVTFELAKPEQMTVRVDLNADVLDGIELGQVEELWVTAPDGVRSQGWLIRPAAFDPAKKYPLVLWIHGGPWSMYDVGFNWAFQNWAAEGYAVLYMNPRGSTGYGQEFVNGIHHAYPGKDYDDLMAGVDAALTRPWVDGENLFVCGGSGGGVLTAWIVGHTDRFRAAASMRPVIDWQSFVGTTDSPLWYDQFEKLPWEDPSDHHRRSPLSYVANVKTPVLVMTGEADLRTPITQSEEYYRALKLLKKETLLIRMPEEFHGWRRPSHRLAQQLYLRAWFEKYRTGKAAPENEAP